MCQPMRILQVFAQMNRGGAETMIMDLYRNIDRNKIQFDFVVHTTEKCDFDEEIEKLGGKIFRIPKYNGLNHFSYKNEWQKFFNKYPKYSIIHGHVRSTASIYLKIAKQNGLTTISHSHSTSSGTGFQAIVKNCLQYPIRHISEYFFACSESSGQWLFGRNIVTNDKFVVLKNAIEIEKFEFNSIKRELMRSEFLIDNKYVIGHVGRFHPMKNHEFLVDVFDEINRKNSDTVLLLVGDGPNREKIEDIVKKKNLEHSVIFTGVRSDVADILQAMDVFIFPSFFEGLGIVVVEAQASGLDCIVSERIPKEAIVTNKVQRISLSKSPEYWASLAEKQISNIRESATELVKANGYDINETALFLEEFYLGVDVL